MRRVHAKSLERLARFFFLAMQGTMLLSWYAGVSGDAAFLVCCGMQGFLACCFPM